MFGETRNPFFELAESPLYLNDGSEVRGRRALINAESRDVLGFVAPRYDIVTNKMVDGLFNDSLALLGVKDVKVLDHLNADTSIWARSYILDDDRYKFDVGNGDVSSIMIRIYNAYNGKNAFGFKIMAFRYMCENGLIMGITTHDSMSFKHFNNAPEKMAKHLELKLQNLKTNIDLWMKWYNEPMSIEDFTLFLNDSQLTTKRLNEAAVGYWTLVQEREKLNATKWLAFNVLTYMATHVAKARHGANIFSHGSRNLYDIAREFTTQNM